MRFWFLGVLGLLGCSPTVMVPPPSPSPSPVPASPAPTPTTSSLAQPVATAAIPTRTPVTELARARARTALRQALELWSSGRAQEASAFVDLGLIALERRLPDDATSERLGHLFDEVALADNGSVYAVSDAETLLTVDTTTGRFLGMRLHEQSNPATGPGVSPNGSVVVVGSAAELLVYDTKGLVLRQRIAARNNAPFAFIADDKLATVRLGPAAAGVAVSRGQLLQRTLTPSADGKRPETSEAESDPELSDDEIVVTDLRTGKTEKVLKLAPPPDQGLMRKVASLPPSQRCNETDECRKYELNPVPIGRRVEQLRIASGMVVASWHGGATTFHRLRDGKLIGAFRSRGERWKPGLVAIWPNPPRAAVATSLPDVGRGNEPPFSVTALVDLTQGRVLELLDECRWTTGLAFSADGTKLMVGDLRRACLHDARNGRHLETTEELRPLRGVDDNQQDVAVRTIPEGRWLLTTLDGTYGVFEGHGGRALYRGKSELAESLVAADDRSLYVADFSGGEAQLITFGPAGVQRRILRSEEIEHKRYPPEAANSPEGKRAILFEQMTKQSCLIEGFRLPLELCRSSRPGG